MTNKSIAATLTLGCLAFTLSTLSLTPAQAQCIRACGGSDSCPAGYEAQQYEGLGSSAVLSVKAAYEQCAARRSLLQKPPPSAAVSRNVLSAKKERA
jgi:hypothetical protein